VHEWAESGSRAELDRGDMSGSRGRVRDVLSPGPGLRGLCVRAGRGALERKKWVDAGGMGSRG